MTPTPAKAFADSDGTLDYDANAGSLWQPKNDGYWYYQKPLYAGTAAHPEGAVTDPFVVTINLNRALKEGEELDVIVVYDSVAAVFNADGSPDLDTAWATGDTALCRQRGRHPGRTADLFQRLYFRV